MPDSTCVWLAALTAAVAPRLALTLYRHHRAALAQIAAQEEAAGTRAPRPHRRRRRSPRARHQPAASMLHRGASRLAHGRRGGGRTLLRALVRGGKHPRVRRRLAVCAGGGAEGLWAGRRQVRGRRGSRRRARGGGWRGAGTRRRSRRGRRRRRGLFAGGWPRRARRPRHGAHWKLGRVRPPRHHPSRPSPATPRRPRPSWQESVNSIIWSTTPPPDPPCPLPPSPAKPHSRTGGNVKLYRPKRNHRARSPVV